MTFLITWTWTDLAYLLIFLVVYLLLLFFPLGGANLVADFDHEGQQRPLRTSV